MAALPLVAVALAWGTVELKADYWARIDGAANDPIVMPLAREIASHTAAGDPVAVVGLDWSPAVLYYAHRRGHMVTEHTKDVAFDLIHRDGYRHLAVTRSGARRPLVPEPLAVGRRDGAAHVRSRGHGGRASTSAAVVATDPDPELAARLEQAPTLRRAPQEIVCGRGTRLAGRPPGDVASPRGRTARGTSLRRRSRARPCPACRLRRVRTRRRTAAWWSPAPARRRSRSRESRTPPDRREPPVVAVS